MKLWQSQDIFDLVFQLTQLMPKKFYENEGLYKIVITAID